MSILKVSIITVCYNSEKYISEAIASVFNQDFSEIEHIVIDGASTDNTVELIRSLPNRIKLIISEKDKGIYDAMNKGINYATGDIIAFLNSDDLYIDNHVISNIVDIFNNRNCDIVYADLFYVKRDNVNKIVRLWSSGIFKPNSFKKGWHPPHPTFIVKKEIYDEFGSFNINFKLAADFELMLRFLEKHRINFFYYQKPIIKMRLGGATSKNIRNIIKQNFECYKAFKTNKLHITILYPFFRLIPKMNQFLNK